MGVLIQNWDLPRLAGNGRRKLDRCESVTFLTLDQLAERWNVPCPALGIVRRMIGVSFRFIVHG
jgi:hypothetical protein